MSSKFYQHSARPDRFSFYSLGATEPNMRVELERMFDGIYPEIPKSQIALLRKMRRDSNGDLQPCSCVDLVTHEPDRDTLCAFCMGVGYFWDEIYIETYKVVLSGEASEALAERLMTPGTDNIPLTTFYTRSSVDITEDDKIVELLLNEEGRLVQPIKRRGIYRIGTAVDLRSDRGKLEYWKLTCFKEKYKFLNG